MHAPSLPTSEIRGGQAKDETDMPKRTVTLILFCIALVLARAVQAEDPPRPRPDQSAPTPIPAVARLLEEAAAAAAARRSPDAVSAAERALTAAKTDTDFVSIALAQRELGLRYGQAGRSAEALAAWQEAVALWKSVEDGPGQVEAQAQSARYLFRQDPAAGQAALDDAARLALAETRRPVAAAAALNAAAIEYYYQGRLLPARQAWTTALQIHQKLAEGSLEVAALRNNLGSAIRGLGDLKGAREEYQQALAIRSRWVPGSLAEAETRQNLGMVTRDLGNASEARVQLQQALEVQKRSAPGSLGVASTLHTLGSALRDMGDLTGARAVHQEALDIRRLRAPGSLDEAASLDKLGLIARDQSDYQEAHKLQAQGLEIRERVAPESLAVAESLNNLGATEVLLADTKSAAARFERAMTIQKMLAPGSLDVATTLSNQADLAFRLGDLPRARILAEQALEIQTQRTPDSPSLAITLGHLGRVAYRQGDWDTAALHHQRALALQQKIAPDSLDVASSLHNLGVVAQDQGDDVKAREYFQRALDIQQKLAPNSEKVAATLANLGAVIHSSVGAGGTRNVKDATKSYEQSLEIQRRKAPQSLAVAACLNNLGAAAQYSGNVDGARRYYQEALGILEKISPDSLDLVTSLDNLASLAALDRNWQSAAMYEERAWGIVRQQGQSVLGDDARQAFGRFYGRYAARLVSYRVNLRKVQEAFAALEDGRAQALLQLMLERGVGPGQVDPKLWAEYQEALQAQGRAYEDLTRAREAGLLNPGEATRSGTDAARVREIEARQRAQGLLARVREAAPDFFVASGDILEARRSLEPGTVLLAYSVAVSAEDRSTVLFVVPAADSGRPIEAYPLNTNEKELREKINTLHAKILLGRNAPPDRAARILQSAQVAAREVYGELFPPAAQTAVRNARRVVISPDGPLWDLPFAALVTNAAGPNAEYLGLAKPLTYTQSLALYARAVRSAGAPSASPAALVVGDPDLQTMSSSAGSERSLLLEGRDLPRLPNAAAEAAAVARLYGVQPMTGAEAGELSVRSEIEKADLVHLATHGYLRPMRAMSSGLLLAAGPVDRPSASPSDADGALLAWEIQSQLRLKADLVVLSACDTARGAKVKGEGLVGLTRALQVAGARSVIASQWQVADESTALLMQALHQEVRRGTPKDEALRRAAASVERNKAFANPFFWAPFLLVGDPANRLFSQR